jgi:hypothetical protein
MALLIGLWAVPACPGQPAIVVREATPPPHVDMSLGPDDVFEVRVYGEAELTGIYRVSADGAIDCPADRSADRARPDDGAGRPIRADRAAEGIFQGSRR